MKHTISSDDYKYVTHHALSEAAIQIADGKELFVISRLEPVARRLGYASISHLIDEHRKTKDENLGRKIIESLTTHETSFFRDITPFIVLKNTILPEIIIRCASTKELTIWCAAASSGQEPVSVALLIKEHFPALAAWNIRIVATDISNAILTKALSGTYSQFEVDRGLTAPITAKYFSKNRDNWTLRPDILRMIDYRPQNLLAPISVLAFADVVFLRNVLIYFDVATKKHVLASIRKVLPEGGYLFLGAAETTINLDDSFEKAEFTRASCYRKVSATGK